MFPWSTLYGARWFHWSHGCCIMCQGQGAFTASQQANLSSIPAYSVIALQMSRQLGLADLVRVVATKPNTLITVHRHGSERTYTISSAGDFIELAEPTQLVLTATYPVLVAHILHHSPGIQVNRPHFKLFITVPKATKNTMTIFLCCFVL